MSGCGESAKQEAAWQRGSSTDDAVLSSPFVRALILSLGPPALVDGAAMMWCRTVCVLCFSVPHSLL